MLVQPAWAAAVVMQPMTQLSMFEGMAVGAELVCACTLTATAARTAKEANLANIVGKKRSGVAATRCLDSER